MISTLKAGAESFDYSRFYKGKLLEKKPGFLRATFSVLTGSERRRFHLLIVSDILVSLLDILSLALLLWIVQFYLQPTQPHLISTLRGVFDKGSVVLIAVFFL